MAETDQIVVLGWDALDLELMDTYGVADDFGVRRRKIETYVNEAIDEPHTKELWPTMITGQKPPEHGIRAVTESDGVDWNNDWLRRASRFADGIVPQRLRTAVGSYLESRGAALNKHYAHDYGTQGIETVFGATDRPISIPNYITGYDERHGLDAHRNQLWGAMALDKTHPDGIQPTVDIDTVQDILGRAVGQRLTHTLSAIQSGAPVVWTWFGYLDSVGHINPTLEYDLEPEAYQLAAAVTQLIRSVVDDTTTVIAISDHGLQAGHHTHYATVASNDPDPITEIEAVWQIADWIRGVDADGQPSPTVDPERSFVEMNDHLEAMGYL